MSEQEQASAAPSEEVTLDDVYKEYNVEDVAKSFNAQPPQQQAPQQAPPPQPSFQNVPDPAVDIDGFKNWAGQVQAANAEQQNVLNQLRQQITQFTDMQRQQAEKEDIRSAVEKLSEKVGRSPDFLEVALAHKASQDPKLLSIWENRHSNPKALDAALNALGNQWAKDWSAPVDNQIVENVRAAKASRDQMATTQQPDPNADWKLPKTQDFDAKWRTLLQDKA